MFTALRDNLQTEIVVANADDNPEGTWTVMQIYIGETLVSTSVQDSLGGTTVIDGVTYTTTAGDSNLIWTEDPASSGNYTFTINNANSPSFTSPLTSGVYKITLLVADAPTIPAQTDQVVGEVIDTAIMCCVADKLNKAYDPVTTETKCKPEDLIKTATEVNTAIKSSRYSASVGEFKNAQCTYDIAATLCSSECECGCS